MKMMMNKGNLQRKCLDRKWNRMAHGILNIMHLHSTYPLRLKKLWGCLHLHEKECVPADVPKGHFVVYVGQKSKRRYVLKLSLLKDPLFVALLHQAEEVFGFSTNCSKLSLPCNESVFLHTLLQCSISKKKV